MKRAMTLIAAATAVLLLATSCDSSSETIAEKQEEKPVDDGTILHLDDIMFDGSANATEKKDWYGARNSKGYKVISFTETGSVGTSKYGYGMSVENKAYKMGIAEEWSHTLGKFFGGTNIVYYINADSRERGTREIEKKFSCKLQDQTDMVNEAYIAAGSEFRSDFYLKTEIKSDGESYTLVFSKVSQEPFASLQFQHYSF